MNKVLEGDKEAFRYFIKHYQSMAMSIAIPLVKDRVDAEDVVQSAFINAFKRLGSFQQDALFSSWFYKIVVNEGLQFLRKKKQRRRLASGLDVAESELVTFNNAVQSIDQQEQQKRVAHALQQLNPKESLVLNLHYLHDQSLAEIVDTTGFTLSNVKVLLHRGRKSFASLFTHSNMIAS